MSARGAILRGAPACVVELALARADLHIDHFGNHEARAATAK